MKTIAPFAESWTDEQKQQLISEVKDFPALWDSAIPDHKNRQKIESIWSEIYAARDDDDGHSLEEIRKQWKNLRDSFFKQKRRVDFDSDDFEPPKWKFFAALIYLAPELEEKLNARISALKATDASPPLSPLVKRPSASGEETDSRSETSSPSAKQAKHEPEHFVRFGEHVADTLLRLEETNPKAAYDLEIKIRRAMVDAMASVERGC